MPARFKALTLDATDHQALADWWCRALGYLRRETPAGRENRPEEWPVPLYDPTGHGPMLWLIPVPEPKTVKNRLHIDVYGSTDELVAQGAVVIRRRSGDAEWDVLADPEGNEFCVFSPKRRATG